MQRDALRRAMRVRIREFVYIHAIMQCWITIIEIDRAPSDARKCCAPHRNLSSLGKLSSDIRCRIKRTRARAHTHIRIRVYVHARLEGVPIPYSRCRVPFRLRFTRDFRRTSSSKQRVSKIRNYPPFRRRREREGRHGCFREMTTRKFTYRGRGKVASMS